MTKVRERVRVLTILLTVVLSACTAVAAAPEPVRIPVRMTEFSYGTALLEAPAGLPLVLAVTNAGKVDHDLVIDELGLRVLLRAGESAEATVGPLAARTYLVRCTIPTHQALGMTAALVVTER